VADRGRLITLLRSVRSAPDAESGRRLIQASLSKVAANLVSETEVEAIRGRVAALTSVPDRPKLHAEDFLAALAVFLWVVISTFPVVLPFVLVEDVGVAKNLSRGIALAMLFFGGIALGRYAGYGNWRVGLMMAGLGAAIVAAIRALGG
jgi:VIT1/CCC1 family predicted Fe2+/Mn2+ transporter